MMTKRHLVRLLVAVVPWIILAMGLKLIIHRFNLEVIPLNPIFSALIGANVFLLGFLISGVLSDYKESERLPGEVAAILHSIADEITFVSRKGSDPEFVSDRLAYLAGLAGSVREWFYKRTKTRDVMALVDGLTDEYILLEQHTQPNYIARLKQEQNSLRRTLIRIHTIRETGFIASGYFIARTASWLLILGLVFMKMEPFSESLFFVGLVTYLMIFLMNLIRDLDNPFGYYEEGSQADVSLKPVDDVIAYLEFRSKPVCRAGA